MPESSDFKGLPLQTSQIAMHGDVVDSKAVFEGDLLWGGAQFVGQRIAGPVGSSGGGLVMPRSDSWLAAEPRADSFDLNGFWAGRHD
jgi:hypothetical protein